MLTVPLSLSLSLSLSLPSFFKAHAPNREKEQKPKDILQVLEMFLDTAPAEPDPEWGGDDERNHWDPDDPCALNDLDDAR